MRNSTTLNGLPPVSFFLDGGEGGSVGREHKGTTGNPTYTTRVLVVLICLPRIRHGNIDVFSDIESIGARGSAIQSWTSLISVSHSGR